MKKYLAPWSTVMTITVFLSAFIIPVLPDSWGKIPARLGFTLIFIAGVLSIDKKKRYMLYVALGALLLEWVSMLFALQLVMYASRLMNIVFFLIVVYTLIWQISTSKVVTSKEIMESISCYILLGIVFSVVINLILLHDPAAYNTVSNTQDTDGATRSLSQSMYYGFITLTTVGYGDILPLKPYTRSLATLISITGQLYIAIIISLLVGKFASRNATR